VRLVFVDGETNSLLACRIVQQPQNEQSSQLVKTV
jgi:hypothetical protein